MLPQGSMEGNMRTKVFLRHDFAWDRYEVYFIEDDPVNHTRRQIFPGENGQWKSEALQEGCASREPSMILSRDMLESFIEATRDIIPASEATQAHLKDAIAVRDKLLNILTREPEATAWAGGAR
jgi:hypothetical protein